MDKSDGDNLKGTILGNPENGVYPQIVLWSHINTNTFFDENGILKDRYTIEPDYVGDKLTGFSIVPKRISKEVNSE